MHCLSILTQIIVERYRSQQKGDALNKKKESFQFTLGIIPRLLTVQASSCLDLLVTYASFHFFNAVMQIRILKPPIQGHPRDLRKHATATHTSGPSEIGRGIFDKTLKYFRNHSRFNAAISEFRSGSGWHVMEKWLYVHVVACMPRCLRFLEPYNRSNFPSSPEEPPVLAGHAWILSIVSKTSEKQLLLLFVLRTLKCFIFHA